MINKIIQDVVQPEMIILFGSYAKDTYVEHRYKAKDGTDYEYITTISWLLQTIITKRHQARKISFDVDREDRSA